jgi:hypothetical protein
MLALLGHPILHISRIRVNNFLETLPYANIDIYNSEPELIRYPLFHVLN